MLGRLIAVDPSMTSPKTKPLRIALGVGGVFMALIALIIFLRVKSVITPQMALLMFVGMLGLYVGFGALIAVYRFISKLE
jgi:xanthosine utilization system XapX-like protein